ncbi:hypothetical protein BKA67DRAFT_572575 [Truncatella angustata]|uniref:Uncharacterized protein n=1 Tax=Truncatella angustata TaxID=152316 RepID=A0A9P8ZVF6_9PEZI|nr:uncharacterized protein BKA67DRAFT_572575 [Truncatella angustata]KAH6651975.1 hypothetical protein BKA67DRAFT_572575 [Truncatella angustata]KAH8205698.1 hypothetical protein TruAng_000192 [Truncatella angustata]
MGIASGIGHFFQSIIEVIQGIFQTIINVFTGVFQAIFNVFALALHTVADAGKGAVHFIEGTLGFAIHNFFLLGTVAAAVFGYLLYQQRQQGSTRAGKTLKSN